jgi:hypothetical protein
VGIVEMTERIPFPKQTLDIFGRSALSADMRVKSVENCLARADLPDLLGRPLYLKEQHRCAPDGW